MNNYIQLNYIQLNYIQLNYIQLNYIQLKDQKLDDAKSKQERYSTRNDRAPEGTVATCTWQS